MPQILDMLAFAQCSVIYLKTCFIQLAMIGKLISVKQPLTNNNDTTIYKVPKHVHEVTTRVPTSGSRDECRTVPEGHRPLDQAHGLEPLARL